MVKARKINRVLNVHSEVEYVQDDLKLWPNLTVNLGLRYEKVTVPTEAHGLLSNLRQLIEAKPHLGSPFFQNPTLRNFEPRLGFAWDITGKGTTVLRAGAGIFYSMFSVAPFTGNPGIANFFPPASLTPAGAVSG